MVINDCRRCGNTSRLVSLNIAKILLPAYKIIVQGMAKCTDFGILHKKMPEIGDSGWLIDEGITIFYCCDSRRARRWYCDGVRPVMRLNDETNVERDLKPTLSEMASMV